MTQNQIAYWNYKEKVRNDRAVETETNRANMAREAETNRSNRMREYQTFQQRMQDRELKRIDQRELERSHRVSEDRDYKALEEQKRHNKAIETMSLSQSEAAKKNADTQRLALYEQARVNQVKERQQADVNRSTANLNQARVYQGYEANELQSAYTYGSLAETNRANLAAEHLKQLGIAAEEFRNKEIVRHNLAQERENKRHNQESEERQVWSNIINAGQLFNNFSRTRNERHELESNQLTNTMKGLGKLVNGRILTHLGGIL